MSIEKNTKLSVRLMSVCMQMGLDGGDRVAFVLVGEPGIGKTQGVRAVCNTLAEKLGKDFPAEIWSGPQIQAEDAAGLPVPDLEAGTTRLLPLRIGDQVTPAGMGVVCIDEMGSVSPSQEAAFLNFLQGGRLGERVLDNKIALGAMMNPANIASNGRDLGLAASNRFVWIDWKLEESAWFDYMLGGKGLAATVDVLPKDWEKQYGHIARSYIVSYVRKNPSALQKMPNAHDGSQAWPSPRSWETAARLLAAVMSTGERKESDLAYLAVEGCVGAEAQSFMSFLIEANLPDPEELLEAAAKDSEKALKKLPERHDHKAVTLEAVAVAATQEHKDRVKRWETAWELVGPVFIKEQDVGLNAAKYLATNKPEGAKNPPETLKVLEILRKAGIIASPKKR